MIALLLGCDEDFVPTEGVFLRLSSSMGTDCDPHGEAELTEAIGLAVASVSEGSLVLATLDGDIAWGREKAECYTCTLTGRTFDCPDFVRPYTVKPGALDSAHWANGAWIDNQSFRLNSWATFTVPYSGQPPPDTAPPAGDTESCVMLIEEVWTWSRAESVEFPCEREAG